jgi:hypothetical protein
MPRRFALTAPRLKENDVERACCDFLRLRGYWVIRQQSGLFKTADGRWIRVGEPGVPDYAALHAVYPGFMLEIKRPGGTLSPDQIQKIAELRMGYRLAIAVIDKVEDLLTWLDVHEG